MFLHGGTSISWKSYKQTLVATSMNHSEIIALYDGSRECGWLRRMIDHIQKSCGIGGIESSTIIYEDNTTYCHARFLCQNQVLIVCMIQDQMFHTYGQKCSQITKCHNIEYNYYINNVFKD
jgi:hypothetical protein